MSIHLGYIVQIVNDDDFTPYHGTMKLYRNFELAVDHSKELRQAYLEDHAETYDGPFETYAPTEKQCYDAGSVVVFRSLNCTIWIDRVVE